MSRTIKVKVVDKNGYGLSGYRIKAYGGEEQRTNRDGTALVDADGSTVTIFVNGRTEYAGSVSRCPNPLVIERS